MFAAVNIALLFFLLAGPAFANEKAAGNVNEDPLIERVTVGSDGKLYLWDKQGAVIAGWPKDLSAENRVFTHRPRMTDVDMDLKEEIIALSRHRENGETVLHVFKGDGRELENWRFVLPWNDIVETPLIADVNHDSILDIAVVTVSRRVYLHSHVPGFPQVAVFRASTIPFLSAGDPDNNGRMDLFLVDGESVRKFNPMAGKFIPIPLPTGGETILGALAFADTDGDGYGEILYSTTGNRLVAVNLRGDLRYSIQPEGGMRFVSGTAVSDVDLDRVPELIILTDTQRILAYELNGAPVAHWDRPLLYRQPLPGDGVVANDIYRGLFSTVEGWDAWQTYRNKLGGYSGIYLGENVHDFDASADLLFAEPVEITDVNVFPLLITPNGDGANDFAQIAYRLSDEALVTLELYNRHGQYVTTLARKERRPAGAHTERFEGINTNDSLTPRDDRALPSGGYTLRIVAQSRDGLISSAGGLVLINGLKAEIESPPENALVHGAVSVTGTAIDPNIGEGNLNADFRAYKVYARPGVWSVSPEMAARAGESGSGWLAVPVPARNQCFNNDHNEGNDARFPTANVSCRPVQHGLLALLDTADPARTPNGAYTLLLKTLDSAGNDPLRIGYDTRVVQVFNAAGNDPALFANGNLFDRNNPANPVYQGPRLTLVRADPDHLSRESSETTLEVVLENETADLHIDIHRLNGNDLGPAVAVYALNNRSAGSHILVWRGTNTLGRPVDGGRYRVRVTATAVDGTGADVNEAVELSVERGFSSRDRLSILSFDANPRRLNPFGFGNNLEPDRMHLAYALSKEGKASLHVYDQPPEQGGKLLKIIQGGKYGRAGQARWDGTGDSGVILPAGKEYVVRLLAEGMDIGNVERIHQDIVVRLDPLQLDPSLTAVLTRMVGNPALGEIFDDKNGENITAGNPDFLWRAKATGYLEVPFTYWLRARGIEDYQRPEQHSTNLPVFACGDLRGGAYHQNTHWRGIQRPPEGRDGHWVERYKKVRPDYDQEAAARAFPDGYGGWLYRESQLVAPFVIERFDIQAGMGGIRILEDYEVFSHDALLELTHWLDQWGAYRDDEMSHHSSKRTAGASFEIFPDGLHEFSSLESQPYISPGGNAVHFWYHGTTVDGRCERTGRLCPAICGYTTGDVLLHDSYRDGNWDMNNMEVGGRCDLQIGYPAGRVSHDRQGRERHIEDSIVLSERILRIHEFHCGDATVTARGTVRGTRQWPLPGETVHVVEGRSVVASSANNLPLFVRRYDGPLGSADGMSIPGTVRDVRYDLEAENFVNGIAARARDDNQGSLILSGLRLSRIAGEKWDGRVQATPLDNGGNPLDANNPFQSDAHDPFLADAPYRKIWGLYSGFNRDRFQRVTPPVSFYTQGYLPNVLQGREVERNLYTFSDVVRLAGWNIELNYPNISLDHPDGENPLDQGNDPLGIFAVDAVQVTPPGVRGAVNANTEDVFRLRLLPEAQPKRFVEIHGFAAPNYELFYYDADEREPAWHPISPRTQNAVNDGVLAHWDVTKLNGRHYTIVLRSLDPNSNQMNQATFNIGIGTEVDTADLEAGENREVCTPFRRTCVRFGEGALDDPALVTVNAVPREEADFELPDGTAPIGPIFDIRPDGLEMDPNHPAQLDLVFTPEELRDLFGVDDPAEVVIYHLAGNNILEPLATVWELDAGSPDNPYDDVYRFTALLDHFSQYFLARKNWGHFVLSNPEPDQMLKGTAFLQGRVENEGQLVDVREVRVKYYPEGSPLAVRLIRAVRFAKFNIPWNTAPVEDGRYVLLFEAENADGEEIRWEVPVIVDNSAASTLLFVNGEIVPDGENIVAAVGAVVEFRARDAGGVDRVEFSWDAGYRERYEGPFTLPFDSGEHLLRYRAVDLSGNLEAEKSATLAVDAGLEGGNLRRAGIPRLVFEGPLYAGRGAEQIWISAETLLGFADAPRIYHYLDGLPQLFEENFTLAGREEGLYTVTYYSADEQGRRGTTRRQRVVLDKSAPETGLELRGPHLRLQDAIIVRPETEIFFDIRDGGRMPSGRESLVYRLNDGPWVPHLGLGSSLVAGEICQISFRAEEIPENGFAECVLSWKATDRVGNEEAENRITLKLDDVAPRMEIGELPEFLSPNGDGRLDSFDFSVWASDNFSSRLFVDFLLRNDAGGEIVVWNRKPLEGVGPVYSLFWDGMTNGERIAEGRYSAVLRVSDEEGNVSAGHQGTLHYDVTPPLIRHLGGDVLAFSPNGDDVTDVVAVRYHVADNLFENGLRVSLALRPDGGNFTVEERSETVAAPPHEHTLQWNGRNANDNPAFDGAYHYLLTAADPAGNISAPEAGEADAAGRRIVMDRVPPVSRISARGGHFRDPESEIFWAAPDVTFLISAEDPFPGSGVLNSHATFREGRWNVFGNGGGGEFRLPQGACGEHILRHYAVDAVGNGEPVQRLSIHCDNQGPRVSHAISEPKIGDGERVRVSPRTIVTLEAEDGREGSGLAGISIEVPEDEIETEYEGPFSLNGLPDGPKTIGYQAHDRVSNVSPRTLVALDYDARAPRTELLIGDPKFVEGERTYVSSATTLRFNAVGERDDVDRTEYRLNNDAPWELAGIAPFQLPEERAYRIHFRSFDLLGNAELENIRPVIVDDTAPDPELIFSQGQGQRYVTGLTEISLGGDFSGAGIVAILYRVDGGEWQTYRGPFSLQGYGIGSHTIEYYSIDQLGNRSQARLFAVQLINVLIQREDFGLPRTLVWLLTNDPAHPARGANGRFVQELLEEMGGYHRVVTSREAFHEELRSDRYTTYILAADVGRYRFEDTPEAVRMFRELKTRIDKGEAFLNMAGHARLEGNGWRIFRENWNRSEEPFLDRLDLVPALRRRTAAYRYGDGVIVEFSANVGEMAGGEEGEAVLTAVSELLHAVRPRGETIHPSEVMDTRLTFSNSGEMPVVLEVEETYPEGSRIETRATGREVPVRERAYEIPIPALGSASVEYLYRFPPEAGEVLLTTRINARWENGIRDRGSLEASYTVEPDEVAAVFEELGNGMRAGAGKSVGKSLILFVPEEKEAAMDRLLDIVDATPRNARETQRRLDEAVESVQVTVLSEAKDAPAAEVPAEVASEKVNEPVSFGEGSPTAGGGCRLAPGGGSWNSFGLLGLIFGLLLGVRVCAGRHFGQKRGCFPPPLRGRFGVGGMIFLPLLLLLGASSALADPPPLPTAASNGAGMQPGTPFESLTNQEAVNPQNGNLFFQKVDFRFPGPLELGLYRSYNIGTGPMKLEEYVNLFEGALPDDVVETRIDGMNVRIPYNVDRIEYENANVNLGVLGRLRSEKTEVGRERFWNQIHFDSGSTGWQTHWSNIVGVVFLLNVTPNSPVRPAIVLLIRHDGSAEPYDFLTGESLWDKAGGARFETDFGETPDEVDNLQNIVFKDESNRQYHFDRTGSGEIHYQVYFSYPCDRWGHFTASISNGVQTFSLTRKTCHGNKRLPGWKAVGFRLRRMEDDEGHRAESNRLDPSQDEPQRISDEQGREILRFPVGDGSREAWEAPGIRGADGQRVRRRWEFQWGAENRITAMTDPEGNVTRYLYDPAEGMACVGCAGQVRNIGWSELRNPDKFVQVHYPTGGIVRYEWFGREAVIGEEGGSNTYVLVTEFPDPEDHAVVYQKYFWVQHETEDPLEGAALAEVANNLPGQEEGIPPAVTDDRVRTVIYDLDGSIKEYVFRNILGGLRTTEERLLEHGAVVQSRKTRWNINNDGKRVDGAVRVWVTRGEVTYTESETTYDDLGRIHSQTDWKGLREEYDYLGDDGDQKNLVAAIHKTDGNTRITSRYVYGGNRDVCGNPIKEIQLNYSYTEVGGVERVEKKVCYDSHGNALTEVGKNDYKTQAAIQLSVNEAAPPPEGTEQKIFDSVTGWLLSETDARGGRTDYTYDENGNVRRVNYSTGAYVEYEYDLPGRRMSVMYFDPTTLTLSRITRRFNGLGQTVEEDAGGAVTRTDYTPARQVESVFYPGGKEAHYTYDALGQVSELVMSGNAPIRYTYEYRMEEDKPVRVVFTFSGEDRLVTATYDMSGNLLAMTRHEGDRSWTTRYEYNLFGDLNRVTSPGGLFVGESRDYATGMVTRTFPGGDTHTFNLYAEENGGEMNRGGGEVAGAPVDFQYDPGNGLLERIAFPGRDIRMDYGNRGGGLNRLLSVSDQNGRTRFAYNSGGGTEMVEREVSALSKKFAFYQVRDSYGRLTRQIYPNGVIVYYKYDLQGRVLEVRKGSETGLVLARFEYLAGDQPSAVVYANGVRAEHEYDVAGRVVRMSLIGPDGEYLQQDEYTYDARGRKIGVRRRDGSRVFYAYDGRGQLVLARYFKNGEEEYFDSQEYGYDDDGNRILYRDDKKEIHYEYENGQLTGYILRNGEDPAWQGRLRYRNGNLTAQTETVSGAGSLERQFAYDDENRLVSATVNDYRTGFATRSSYTYDYTGRRESKTVDGETLYYLYGETGDPLMEVDGNGEARTFYVFVGVRRLAKIHGDDLDFYHQDEMDNVVKMTNADGEEIQSVRYDPFGAPSFVSGTAENNILFAGKERDPATGLIYFGGRYYDPALGRFLTRDPVLSGTNHYVYAGNNPILNRDFFGLWGFNLNVGLQFTGTGFLLGATLTFSAGPMSLGVSAGWGLSLVEGGKGKKNWATGFSNSLSGSLRAGPITLDAGLDGLGKGFNFKQAFKSSISRSLMRAVKIPGPMGRFIHPFQLAAGITFGFGQDGKLNLDFKLADIGGGLGFLKADSFLGGAIKDLLTDPKSFFGALAHKPGGLLVSPLKNMINDFNGFQVLFLGQQILTGNLSVFDFTGTFGSVSAYDVQQYRTERALVAELVARGVERNRAEEMADDIMNRVAESAIPAPAEDEKVDKMKKDPEEPKRVAQKSGGQPTTGDEEQDKKTTQPGEPANGTDPILLHSGELLVEETDLRVPAPGMDFAFARTYRSRIEYAGPLGHNWDHNYNKYLVEREEGHIARFDGDGRFDIYKKREDGTYESPSGYFDTLVKNADGSYTIRDKFGTVHEYAEDGRIRLIRGRNNNILRFFHQGEGEARHLARVLDTANREYVFSYDGEGRLLRLRDFSGRGINFGYDQNGDLAFVEDPLGQRIRYFYASDFGPDRESLNHNILRIEDAKGVVYLENSYSIYDRVVRQRLGNEGYFDIEYHAVANSDACEGEEVAKTAYRTRLRDRMGNRTDYRFNCQGNMLAIRRYTRGLRGEEPEFYETRYLYNDDGRVTRVDKPAGDAVEFVYDERGNVLTSREHPVPGRAEVLPLETGYRYDPQFSKLVSETSPTGKVITFVPDDRGNIVQRCLPPLEAGGPAICETYSYNDRGQVTLRVNGEGEATMYEYDDAGNLTAIVRNANIFVEGPDINLTNRFGYDAAGNIVRYTDGLRREYRFEVDRLNRVTREISPAPLNIERRFEYDANGNLTRVWGAGAMEARYTYDELDHVRSKTEVIEGDRTVLTEYQYDLNENVIRAIKPEGNSVCVEYDEGDKPWRVTRGCRSSDASVEEYDYDVGGNLLRLKDGRGNVRHYEYDGYGRLASVMDPLANRADFAWDDEGNLTSMTRRGPPRPGAEFADLSREEFVYDALNRLVRRLRHNTRQNSVTEYAYDRAHRVTTETNPNGHATRYRHDGAGRLVHKADPVGNELEYTYDRNDNVVSVVSRENPERYTQAFEYDVLNRLVKRTDNADHAWNYRYDERGNLLEVTDPKDTPGLDTGETVGFGNRVLYFYDGLNRRVREIKELREGGAGSGRVTGTVATGYVYDGNSRLAAVEDDNGHATQFGYDALDRQVEIILANGQRYTKRYDAAGNLLEELQPNGFGVRNVYDEANRLVRKEISREGAHTGVETFVYDGLSRLVTAQTRDPFNNITGNIVFAYDMLNNVAREEGNGGRGVIKIYDTAGNVISKTLPSGRRLEQRFDALERLTAVGSAGLGELVALAHEGRDRTLYRRYGNNLATAYWHDAVKRVTHITSAWAGRLIRGDGSIVNPEAHIPPANLVVSFAYGYDKAGNRLYEAVTEGAAGVDGGAGGQQGGGALSRVFTYDSLYRLVRESNGVPDPAAEVANPGSQPFSVLNEWRLDGVDNWLERQVVIASPQGEAISSEQFNPNEVNAYTTVDGSPLIYDASGNLIEDATRRYEYNYRNLLTRVVEKGQGGAPDTEVATYGYDALGRRVWKRVPDPAGGPAVFTRYVYEGIKLGAELNAAGAVLREYVYGEGLDDPIAMVVPGGNVGRGRRIYYYHTDALGSVVALTNGQGGVEERYRYDAYGVAEVTDAGGALQDGSEVGNPFQYTGQFFDKETGFYYYKARYYHPQLGRFLQRDPLGYVDGYNLYAYVNNNPLNWVDPLGLNSKEKDKWEATGEVREKEDAPKALSWVDKLQLALDMGGLVPVYGELLDGVNAVIYLIRGDLVNAGLSAAAMVPLVGSTATATKLGVKAGKAARVGAGSVGAVKRGSVVIGENMERVGRYASRIGAETFQGTGVEANRRWIQEVRSSGKQIIDIGPDFTRRAERVRAGIRPGSPFYNMERMETKSYENYFKLFERNGKYRGGTLGVD